MKHLLIAALFLFSIAAQSQTLASNETPTRSINLRIKQEEPSKAEKNFKKGVDLLMTGLVVSTVGAGMAILAPDLVTTPEPGMTPQEYQEQLYYAGNNPDAQAAVTKRYADSLDEYEVELSSMQSKVNTIRGIGVGMMAVGLAIDFSGVIKIKAGL